MNKYSDCPQILRDFLAYHENIKGQSPRTISEYYLDLRMFLRFIRLMRNDMPIQTPLEDIPIKDIDLASLFQCCQNSLFRCIILSAFKANGYRACFSFLLSSAHQALVLGTDTHPWSLGTGAPAAALGETAPWLRQAAGPLASAGR